MSVEIANQVDDELVEAINSLIPQLSRSAPQLRVDQVEDFLSQDGVYVFLFRSSPRTGDLGKAPILGMLTLATFTIPTGKRGWIEDVVVDMAARGQGAGQELVEACLEKARGIGVKTVDLTSRPEREAANRLYVRCGFEPRETNIYRYTI